MRTRIYNSATRRHANIGDSAIGYDPHLIVEIVYVGVQIHTVSLIVRTEGRRQREYIVASFNFKLA